MAKVQPALRKLPSVDEVVRSSGDAVARYGRPAVVNAVRDVLAEACGRCSTSPVLSCTQTSVAR
jgi:hypothetical protein